MVRELQELCGECIAEMRKNEKMRLSKADKLDFENATTCCLCNEEFDSECKKNCKVRDHGHRTGKYRGAAHAKCNINYFSNRYLPVVFHNLKGYDGHQIIKQAYYIAQKEEGSHNISAIPNSCEKFMSISVGSLRFIDSYQFCRPVLRS